MTCDLVFSNAFKPRIAIKFKLKGIAASAKPANTLPIKPASLSDIPKNRTCAIKGPKNKKKNALGTVTIPTNRIALTICSRNSANFLSIANSESFGSSAVTTEIVIIECGNNNIK